ncbi:hypothetical protein T4B_10058 [Trichinella pseudospiralis]|uniref:Uncharacterized protein n=1 Tax=Trichinella pseudospiralis TaxID=6337 RepID=A0A0V1H6K9_TRIPS|nr:hypothetical protein T4B_10058 [Trichinella pseudospiralis]
MTGNKHLPNIETQRLTNHAFRRIIKAVYKRKAPCSVSEQRKKQNAAIFPTLQQNEIISDNLRIKSDGPKFVRICIASSILKKCSILSMLFIKRLVMMKKERHFEKHRINGKTSHRKLAICFSRFVKNTVRML